MKKYEMKLVYEFMSLEEIIKELEKTEYKDRFFMLKTNIKNESISVRPEKCFEEKLKEQGIKYFAYIKFFLDKGKRYGIVAGKTGSSLVNKRSDVFFSTERKHGPSRQFIAEKNFRWYKEEILIVKPIEIDDELKNNKEALAIERDLKKKFNLLGS